MIKKLLSVALIAFAVSANAQQVQNPGFETWANNFPTFWGSIGQVVVGLGQPNPGLEVQTTTKNSGSFAVLLTNTVVPAAGGAVLPGVVGTGPFSLVGGSIAFGYQAYNANPSSYAFYYEYMPMTGDTAFTQVLMTKWNTGMNKRDTLGFGGAYMLAAAVYTMGTVNITYSVVGTPDSVQLIFASSLKASPPSGSKLYVDDVNMVVTTGIQHLNANGTFSAAYPNPAVNTITISSASENAKYAKVYDLTGRMINNYELTNKSVKVDVSSYENGMYFYVITDERNNKLQSAKFNVTK